MTDDRLSSEDLGVMRDLAVRGRYVPPRHVVKLIDEVREWRTEAARMSGLPRDSVRVLVAPCGHVAGIDVTTEVPGFCRDIEEAEEDIGAGFTERRMGLDDARAAAMQDCDHDPKWGVA